MRLSVIRCTDPPQADTALQLEEAAVVEGVRWYDLPSFESGRGGGLQSRVGDLPVKSTTKNQLGISIGRKEAGWSVCISDIDPAKIMS